MLYLLVTAADWRGRPVRVTSLPSWSCRFDSRRPLHRLSLHRDVPRHWNGHDPHWLQGFPGRRDGIHGNLLVIVARGPASAGGCSMVEAGPDSPRSLTNRAGRRGRLGRPASARRGGPRVLGIDSQRLPQAVPGFPVAEQSIQRTARGPSGQGAGEATGTADHQQAPCAAQLPATRRPIRSEAAKGAKLGARLSRPLRPVGHPGYGRADRRPVRMFMHRPRLARTPAGVGPERWPCPARPAAPMAASGRDARRHHARQLGAYL